jgi:serine/threonine protein phosphatase 1
MRAIAIDLLRRYWMPPARAPRGRVPEGCRVYAIGDIHGRLDLLTKIHDLIRHDAERSGERNRSILVYIGDYVDRGPDSRGVLDLLLAGPPEGFERVSLLGNHDQAFLEFLDNADRGPRWFRIGGRETALSYGARLGHGPLTPSDFEALQEELVQLVPKAHRTFLENLHLQFPLGDFLFVHAGLRPGVTLERQNTRDLLWIRNRFLLSRRRHEKIVVHGHSRSSTPDLRPNRIGIDTGAYATGKLTCLVLDGVNLRFLATGSNNWQGQAGTGFL